MSAQTKKKKKWISLSEVEASEDQDRLIRPNRDPPRAFSHPFASQFAPPAQERRASELPKPESTGTSRTAAELQIIHEHQDLISRKSKGLTSFEGGRACSSPAVINRLETQGAGIDLTSNRPHLLEDPPALPPTAGSPSALLQSSNLVLHPGISAEDTRLAVEHEKAIYYDHRPKRPINLPLSEASLEKSFHNDEPQGIRDSGIALEFDTYAVPLRLRSDRSGSSLIQSSNDMATVPFRTSGDARRPNRYENRPPMSTVLCRNGPQCRKFQEGTCGYNHDFASMAPNGFNGTSGLPGMNYAVEGMLSQDSAKRSLNVESPAFTPKTGNAQPARLGISPKAVTAAAFTPRGSGTATPATNSHSKEPSIEFFLQQTMQTAQQQYQEFVPGGSSFLSSPQMDAQQPQLQQQLSTFGDPFLSQQGITGLDAAQAQINPYAQQATSVANQHFFQDGTSFKHPLNYHLYSSIGPRRENLMAFQRSTTDFFIPDDLREDLQRKSEATLQTFANSTLPLSVEYFHSLVAIDTNTSKGQPTFGYPTWVYKAVSGRDGNTYALRRIEGFRLTSEAAIRTVNAWKRINNASMVQIYDAFTGRWFGDSSLVIVTDYHPLSKTLAEKHYPFGRNVQRPGGQITPENELWGYIVQIASAIKTIHEGGLAAQTVMPSKILVTSKNRLRLNGCGVFDVLNHEQRKPVHELQRADLQALGRLILGIAARSQTAHENVAKALTLVSRSYSERLRSCIAWLVAPPPPAESAQGETATSASSTEYNIHTFLNNIADKVVSAFDSTLHAEDESNSILMRELENGRLVRLLAKLNVILERPDTGSTPNATSNPALLSQPSSSWSETGERYYLKLFRDYVFHQVDHEGRPVLDLGHIITCLNKLDAGIDEKIQLISRDEQNIFVVSYKEIKRGFESAWSEISKASNAARR